MYIEVFVNGASFFIGSKNINEAETFMTLKGLREIVAF